MLANIRYIINIFILLFVVVAFSPAISISKELSSEEIKKMQEIYFYARKYFDEGEYEKFIAEFENILTISPEHAESKRMIAKNFKNISKTSKLLKSADISYAKGDLHDTLETLDKARSADLKNARVKSFLLKVLTEMGMEYSLTGNNEMALKYLKRAENISPNDATIVDMINISKSMLANKPDEVDADVVSVNTQNDAPSGQMEDMIKLFENYQTSQNELLKDSLAAQAKLQKIIEESEKEKARLYNMLETREKHISRILGMFKTLFLYVKEHVLLVSIFVCIVLYSGIILMRKRTIKNQTATIKNDELQEKLVESFEKLNTDNKSTLNELDKKYKKLDIIEKELISDNGKERDVGYKILAQFIDDVDYRIRLRAIKILHQLNPDEALLLIEKIIRQEKGKIRADSCELLGEIKTEPAVELLLRLSKIPEDELRHSVLASLVKIANSDKISSVLRKRLKTEIDAIYSQGDWIVV